MYFRYYVYNYDAYYRKNFCCIPLIAGYNFKTLLDIYLAQKREDIYHLSIYVNVAIHCNHVFN